MLFFFFSFWFLFLFIFNLDNQYWNISHCLDDFLRTGKITILFNSVFSFGSGLWCWVDAADFKYWLGPPPPLAIQELCAAGVPQSQA